MRRNDGTPFLVLGLRRRSDYLAHGRNVHFEQLTKQGLEYLANVFFFGVKRQIA